MFKILIADNRKNDREKIAAKLNRNEQWEVEIAKSATVAISMIEQKTYDLVGTEMKMESEESGIRVLESAKQKNSATNAIVFTAYATFDGADLSMEKGASGYISKSGSGNPYDNLYRKVEKILKKHDKPIAAKSYVLPAGSSDFKKIITENYYYIRHYWK